MYETKTSQRNKRKLNELESSVKAEEAQVSDQQLGKEVNWLQDPGNTFTRATQFVRTQAEAWRMKTMLAKVLEAQEEQDERVQKLKRQMDAMEHNHMCLVESIEFKLSSLDQQADTINKKLTVLIKLMRNVVGTEGITGETSGVPPSNPPKQGSGQPPKQGSAHR